MATITGTSGSEVIVGAGSDNEIFGLGGNDSIISGAGDDIIRGDSGGITGKAGKAGKAGKVGKAGDDIIDGGAGDDIIYGDGGDDIITGGSGADTLYGDWTEAGPGSGKGETTGDDTFLIKNIGDGYGDTVYGGTNGGTSGKSGKAGKGTDNDTLDLTGSTGAGVTVTVATTTDSDGNGFDGVATWTDIDSNILGTLDFENIENLIVPCFTRGAEVATEKGIKLIEDLVVGDRIMTRDNGMQELLWVGSTTVPAINDHSPIQFRAGSLRNERELLVSPQHRILINGPEASLLYGEGEVFVAAKYLVNDVSIRRKDGGLVEYFHLLFESHEVVYVDGVWSESFHPGGEMIGRLARESQSEILALFPELSGNFAITNKPLARVALREFEARLLRQDV